MIYYKVVRVDLDDKLLSFNGGNPRYDDWVVEYVPGQVAVPKIANSKLFVFSSLVEAMAFARTTYCKVEIWECTCKGVVEPELMICESLFYINRYWRWIQLDEVNGGAKDTVPGTVWCDSLTLLKKVVEASD